MRFECYRNKAVVVEALVEHSKLAESSIIQNPSFLNLKLKSKLNLTQQKKFLIHRVPNSTKT